MFRYQLTRNRVWFMRRWGRGNLTLLLFTALFKLLMAAALFGVARRGWGAMRAFLAGTWDGLSWLVFAMPPPPARGAGDGLSRAGPADPARGRSPSGRP